MSDNEYNNPMSARTPRQTSMQTPDLAQLERLFDEVPSDGVLEGTADGSDGVVVACAVEVCVNRLISADWCWTYKGCAHIVNSLKRL